MRSRTIVFVALSWAVFSVTPWEAAVATLGDPDRGSSEQGDRREAPGDFCPPGCDCLCCPNHTSVDVAESATGAVTVQMTDVTVASFDGCSRGFPYRVFRPPRHA